LLKNGGALSLAVARKLHNHNIGGTIIFQRIMHPLQKHAGVQVDASEGFVSMALGRAASCSVTPYWISI
jgi:hypothetical protein